MGTRYVRRPPRQESAPVDSGPLVVDEHRSIPLPTQNDTKRFDFGLIAGPNREPIAVGVDSSATGHGIAAVGIESGLAFAWVLKSKKKGTARLTEIGGHVERLFRYLDLRYGVTEICMEEYAFASKGSHSHLIGEVGGQTKVAIARALGAHHKKAHPTFPIGTQVKKFATGVGNSEKSDVKMAVLKKWGWEVKEENAADALCLAMMAKAIHTGTTAFAYEAEVISKLELNPEWQQP